MALLFLEGFEDAAHLSRFSTFTGNTFVTGRLGGIAAANTSNTVLGMVTNDLPASASTMIVGSAIKTSIDSTTRNIQFLESSTQHAGLEFNATTGTLEAYRGSTLIGTSSSGLFPSNTWFYCEVRAVMHDSAGSVTVRINGVQVWSLTSVDTLNGGTGAINRIAFGANSGGGGCQFDDIYVVDETGGYNNTYLGDSRITRLVPNADVTTQWTPSAGSTHYLTVDESTVNTSDYITASTVGLRDLFDFTTISNSAEIFGISLSAHSRKSDAGDINQRLVVVSSGTTSLDSIKAVNASTAFSGISYLLSTDPANTTQWTVSAINSLRGGIETTT